MKKYITLLTIFLTSGICFGQQYRTALPMKDTSSANYSVIRAGKLAASDTLTVFSIGGGQSVISAMLPVHTLGTYTVPTGASVIVFDTLLAAAKLDTIKLDSISHYKNLGASITIYDISGLATDSIMVLPAGVDLINFASGAIVGIKGSAGTFGKFEIVLDPLKKSWIRKL